MVGAGRQGTPDRKRCAFPPGAMGGGTPAHTMTLGPSLIRYVGSLTLAGGELSGQPFRVLPWERKLLRGAFSVDGDIALSLARGNGKTALVAGIATAGVDPDGPLSQRRGEIVCVASSFDQSRLIFEDVLYFLREKRGRELDDRKVWRIQDSANRASVEYRPTGARVRCIGSDPSKAHGLRPALVLADEPSQWDAAKSERMHAALRTGLGKVPDSRMIALGTRPADPEHWFSKLLQDAAFSLCYAAGRDDPPFQKRTWLKANPSLRALPELEATIRREAQGARKDESLLQGFRALRLNLGTSDTLMSMLLEADTWARIEGDAERSRVPIWGIDLGTSAAQSAVAAFWPETGRLECLAAFPTEPGLAERGLRDGVGRLYMACWQRGELITTGGEAVDIGELLHAALERFGRPSGIVCDRWRDAELRDALRKAGLQVRMEVRGQGFKDGAEDVRGFRRACAEGKVTPAKSLLLRSAMAEARTVVDPAGNAKLAKATQGGRRLRARDDAAAAAILAVAAGTRQANRPQRRGWRYAVVG